MEKFKGIVFFPWRLHQRRREERIAEVNRLYEQSKRSQREVNGLLQSLMAKAEVTESDGKSIIKYIHDPQSSWQTNSEIFVDFQSILPGDAPLVSLSIGVHIGAEGESSWNPYLTLVFKGERTFHAHSTEKLKEPDYRSKQPINFWQKINEETGLSRWWRDESTRLGASKHDPETHLGEILREMENIDEILNLLRQSIPPNSITSPQTPKQSW